MKRVLIEVGALVQSSTTAYRQPSYILVEDGIIIEAATGEYTGPRENTDIVKRTNCVALPGFVNSHGHAAMTLLRGAGDDMPLMRWLDERIFPLEAKLTGDAIYWGTQLACLEMFQSGTTCFTDMYMSMHDTARAVSENGIRGVLSWGVVGFDDTNQQRGLENSRDFVERWHKSANGRITTMIGPHAPYTCPSSYLHELANLSEALDVPMQIHLSETKVEVENSLREHQVTPIEMAHQSGLFARKMLAAHCVHVSAEDIALMKVHDVKVAHNPQSNLKLGSGVAPIVDMKRAGLTVGLGTDGAASNNNLDMFEELRLAATLHKGVLMDAEVICAAEAFAMATEESARCVFLPPNHGTLVAGAAADITLLDLTSSHFLPTYDLMSNIVYAAGANDVTDVFVDGRQVLRNRLPLTIDVERMTYEVKKIESLLAFN